MWKARNILFTADDLTGAADLGTALLRAGLVTTVVPSSGGADRNTTGAVAHDLDCRNAVSSAAAARMRALWRAHQAGRPWYHKIDSTLRGALGDQIATVLTLARPPFAALVAANPAHGRATRQGVHYVNNLPLSRSLAADHPVRPMTRSRVADIVGPIPGVALREIHLDQVRQGAARLRRIVAECARPALLVFDAETWRDLRSIAAALRDAQVVFGAAALARYLPATWPLARDEPPPPAPPHGAGHGRALIIAGSAAPATRAQNADVKTWKRDNVTLIEAPATRGDADAIRRALVRRACVEARGVSRIIVSGGETARDVCRALGVQRIRLIQALTSGIGMGVVSGERPFVIVLKPGGFGEPGFYRKACRAMMGLK